MKTIKWLTIFLLSVGSQVVQAELMLPYQFDQLNNTRLVIRSVQKSDSAPYSREVTLTAITGEQQISTAITIAAEDSDEDVISKARQVAFFFRGELYLQNSSAGGRCLRCCARDLYVVGADALQLVGSVGAFSLADILQSRQRLQLSEEQHYYFDVYNELENVGLTSMATAPAIKVAVQRDGARWYIEPRYTMALNQVTYQQNLATIADLMPRLTSLSTLEKTESLIAALQENLVILRLSGDDKRLKVELEKLQTWLDADSLQLLLQTLESLTGEIRYFEAA